MSTIESAQRRAVVAYRSRLASRGLSRFEVVGRFEDRALLRDIARRLATNDEAAAKLREAVQVPPHRFEGTRGEIAKWLLRSPLVGSGLTFEREQVEPRDVEL